MPTQIKGHPIIFSTELIPRILDRTKTQTRRTYGLEKVNENPELWQATPTLDPRFWAFYKGPTENPTELIRIKCPYGGVGDLLWVRETHFIGGIKPNEWAWYRSGFDGDEEGVVWRPSIHMPRWASRITRVITGLRPERLQEISISDCKDEGIVDHVKWIGKECYSDAIIQYSELWDSINAKKYPWAGNWWVWVISWLEPELEFELISVSQEDSAFIEQRRQIRDEIISSQGVSPSVLGIKHKRA